MDNTNGVMPQVTVIPDSSERTYIRRKYSRSALVILLNMAIFNILGKGVIVVICALLGGGFGKDALTEGTKILMDHELASTLLSVIPPILSETVSILLGIKLVGLDLKKLASNRENYSGSTVAKLIVLCFSLQFAAGILATVIQTILQAAGLRSALPNISATNSFGANIILSFYVCLLGPVLEELLYRGVLLQSMRKYNERFAIFLSALIFGLMHQNYQQFILGFLLGIPLAIVTIKYNSIIPSIFTHIFVNTSQMLMLYAMQYFAPSFYSAVQDGTNMEISSLSGSEMALIFFISIVRIGFFIAGGIVGIVSLVKGGNMTRPTPAGKARTLPVLVRSLPWWIVFILYIYLSFIDPFIM